MIYMQSHFGAILIAPSSRMVSPLEHVIFSDVLNQFTREASFFGWISSGPWTAGSSAGWQTKELTGN
jgi:hypothetical protein